MSEPITLTVKINLSAPLWLIDNALYFLAANCQAAFGLGGKIEWEYLDKILQTWDLNKQGVSVEQIADRVPLTKYKSQEQRSVETRTPEMVKADQEEDFLRQVRSYINAAQKMIYQGSII